MINEKTKNYSTKKYYICTNSIFRIWFFYVSDYHRADKDSIKAFTQPNEVSSDLLDNNTMVFKSENATKALICFYKLMFYIKKVRKYPNFYSLCSFLSFLYQG